jgi:hypothetical protein
VLQREVADADRDRVLRSADRDLFAVGRFSPATLEVTGCAENGLERLAVMAAVEANETEAARVGFVLNALGEGILNFTVAGMAPPDENVGRLQLLFRKTLVGLVQADRLDIELTVHVKFTNSGGHRAADSIRINLFRSVRRILVPDQYFECHRVYFGRFSW